MLAQRCIASAFLPQERWLEPGAEFYTPPADSAGSAGGAATAAGAENGGGGSPAAPSTPTNGTAKAGANGALAAKSPGGLALGPAGAQAHPEGNGKLPTAAAEAAPEAGPGATGRTLRWMPFSSGPRDCIGRR